jgi:ABC-type glycerol-3-phosphate transport system substrate-binding protein
MPYTSYKMWVESQFLSKNPPAIFMLENVGGYVWDYGQNGMLINFDKYINKKNPFYPAAKTWKDEFKTVPLASARDLNGNLWTIPFTTYAVAYLYNKKITKEYGVTPPKTWKQFIADGIKIKKHGGSPIRISLTTTDAQIDWVSDIILGCLLRSKIPEINLIHAKGWKFNPYDPKSTVNEKIDLSERIVAFQKGIIDPAKAPAFKVCMKMLKDFSKMWCDDYLGLTGTDVFNFFTAGKNAYLMQGTWGIEPINELLSIMKINHPERAFTWGAFPFPNITKETTDLATAGGVNQNTNMRACIMIPKQKEKWKEKAAVLFSQFITAKKNCANVFKHSELYDLPAIKGLKGKKGTEALAHENKFATFYPFVELWGYNNETRVKFETLNQLYFSNKISMDEYLKRISANQRVSLKQLARIYSKELNRKFMKKELGKDYKQWVD